MKQIVLFLLLLAPGATLAEPDTLASLNQLQEELRSIQHEQQSVYQNYRLAKKLRLMEVQEGNSVAMQHPYDTDINIPPPNYDDVVRAQLGREQRIQQYTDDLKRLSVRYLELEYKRMAFSVQVRELAHQQDE